jgi:hypothetical protein
VLLAALCTGVMYSCTCFVLCMVQEGAVPSGCMLLSTAMHSRHVGVLLLHSKHGCIPDVKHTWALKGHAGCGQDDDVPCCHEWQAC